MIWEREFGEIQLRMIVGKTYNSDEDRLVQLQCDKTAEQWYLPESDIQLPHFLTR